MRSEHNSDVRVCIDNLVKTIRGEVPYAREKGIDGGIIDLPPDEAEVELAAAIDESIESYEPRVDVEDTNVDVINVNGDLKYDIDIIPADEDNTAYVDDEEV